MKRKLLLSSAIIPSLLATGAMAQVVNFHDASNDQLSFPGVGYNELFAGQGAYSDPGNDIWNGFGFDAGYKSTYFYSGSLSDAGPFPQQPANPGNPYAAYNSGAAWVTSTGTSLFSFDTASSTNSGNATSGGQISPITLSVGGYIEDAGIGNIGAFAVPNGSPGFLLGEAAVKNGSSPDEVFTLNNVPPGTYGLYLYGANQPNNRGTSFALNSGAAHNGISGTTNNQMATAALSFVEGQNFVIFQNVTPNGSGQIVITASPNSQDGVGNTDLTGETDVNGFQLIYNPPPTAVAPTLAQNIYAGGTASFSFSPAFATSPIFQWQSVIGGVTNVLSNGVNISGALTTNLTIANVSSANVGLYQCVISTSTGTNTTPAAPLTILPATNWMVLETGDSTNIVGDVLSTGDTVSDFGNTLSAPYNTIPPAFDMAIGNAIDGTLFQYENFGANGSVPPFVGPVGFIVSPSIGSTVAKGIRLFTSSSHPEDDPYDYLLEGSTDGVDFTPIAGGLLGLPAQRNAAGGLINVTNEVLKEIDFANSTAYTTYRVTFTNVNNDTIASNGVQIAEVQILGSFPSAVPTILQQPTSAETLLVGGTLNANVVVGGSGPFTYQWYLNSSSMVTGATNASLTISDVTTPSSGSVYTCVISNPSGSVTSAPVTLTVVTPTPYQQDLLTLNPLGYWPLTETSGTIAFDYVNGYNGSYTNFSDISGYSLAQPGVPYPGFGSNSYSVQIIDGAYVDIPEGPFNITNAISVVGWIQMSYETEFASILGHGDNSYRITVNGSGQPGFNDGSDNTGDATGATSIVDGTWHMVTGVYTGGSSTSGQGLLYIDGLLVASNGIHAVAGENLDVWLGGSPDYTNRFIDDGNLSSLAIIPQALTAAQVQALYSASEPGPHVTVPTTPIPVDQDGNTSITGSATGGQPLYFQWFYLDQNDTPNLIPAATNLTVDLTDVQLIQAEYQYYLVVSNAYGVATSSYVTLNIASGAPVIQTNIGPAELDVLPGTPITYSVAVTGTQPFYYQWYAGSTAITGATNATYSFAAVAGSINYSVVISNASGPVTSATANVLASAPVPVINFNAGTSDWTLTGSGVTPTLASDLLTLTTGQGSEAASAFYDTAVSITGFIASYTYTASGTGTRADGATFCLQNSAAGPSALGGGGGELGVYGISPSVEFEMNIYTGDSGGVGYQLGTEGNVPSQYAGMGDFISTSPVSFDSGDPINVLLSYVQDVLTITLTDATTKNTYTASVTTNLPAAIGSSVAYVGFTAATGGLASTQTISNFVFSVSGTPTLALAKGAAGSVIVSWPVSVSSSFVLQESTTVNGPWTTVTTTPTVVNSQNEVTLTPGTTTAFFKLTLE
jgi:hypothetical protein